VTFLQHPLLQKFSRNGHTTKLIFSSEPEPPETESEETDLETSFYVSQKPELCFNILLTLINFNSDDIEQPYTSIQSGSTLDEVKYIEFRSSLLELFTHCPSCLCSCPGTTTKPKGTFGTIKQACSHCGYQRSWLSQHHIKDIPAGNIMLSAAILYSGGTATKFLRVLSHIKLHASPSKPFTLIKRNIYSQQ